MTAAATCAGCEYCQRRFRSAIPRSWCAKYRTPALARCIDYRTKRSAIDAALDYLKRSSLK